jgi:hypothetical protein
MEEGVAVYGGGREGEERDKMGKRKEEWKRVEY